MSIKINDLVSLKEYTLEENKIMIQHNVFKVVDIVNTLARVEPVRNVRAELVQPLNNLKRLNKFRVGDSVKSKKSKYNTNTKRKIHKVQNVRYNPGTGRIYVVLKNGALPNENNLMLKKRAAGNE